MGTHDTYDWLAESLGPLSTALARALDAPEHGATPGFLPDYRACWERIGREAESREVAALVRISGFVLENLDRLDDRTRAGGPPAQEPTECIRRFTDAFAAFVEAPTDIERLATLVEAVQEPAWPLPMDEAQASAVLEQLLEGVQESEGGDGGHGTAERPGETRDEILHPDRLRLEFSEGAERQVVEAFLNEVPELVTAFTGVLDAMARGEHAGKHIPRAQRLAHTIKGSANVTGVPAVATLMHVCEDLLEACHARGSIDPAALEVVIEAGDCLAAQLDYLTGTGPSPEQTPDVVSALLDARARGAAGGSVDGGPAADGGDAGAPPAEAPQAAPRAVTAGDTLRIPTRLADGLLRQVGEVSISNVQLQGTHQDLADRMRTLAGQQEVVRERLAALQDLVDLQGVPLARPGAVGRGVHEQFDPLELDQYNELHGATNALVESIVDAQQYGEDLDRRVRTLGDMLRHQDGLTRELSENVMTARLVPVGTIRSRLERVVRQTVRQTDKEAQLVLEGEDTLIDRHVLDQVTEPLLHILRNAVDHGIDAPAERERMGKPATGTIRMSVHRQGDTVSLRVSDDGRGLDRERIREVAASRALIDDVSSVDETDVERLILLPGFSTRDETTQVSGRGIGMDVVQSRVQEQRGTVDIDSELGVGTTVTLQVPVTLSSMHALLVETERFTIAVPSALIEQLIFSDLGEWSESQDGFQYLFEERTYHASTMEILLGEPGAPQAGIPEQAKPVMLIQGIERNHAVIVERVVGSRHVIIKSLGRFMPDVPGIMGASILGDGGIAPVVDLRDLLGHAQRTIVDTPAAAVAAAEALPDVPLVLVVDDSLSARRSLSDLVADGGYRVATAIDGLEAIEAIEAEQPAAILADFEMPRMNGVELARHLRTNEETRDIAVMMITSRSTEKHRQHAVDAGVDQYVVKPYDEDAVLERLAGLIESRSTAPAGARVTEAT